MIETCESFQKILELADKCVNELELAVKLKFVTKRTNDPKNHRYETCRDTPFLDMENKIKVSRAKLNIVGLKRINHCNINTGITLLSVTIIKYKLI